MRDFRTYICCLFLTCFTTSFSFAQEDYSPKQLKSLAKSAETLKDYYAAIYYYEQYLEKKPADLKIQYHLANSYRKVRNYIKAETAYKKLYEAQYDKEKLVPFHYANMLKSNGKCDKAVPLYSRFIKSYRGEKDDRKFIRLAKNSLAGCESLSEGKSNRRITITQLNQEINGAHMEASPIYLEEDKILFNSLKINGENKFSLKADSLPSRKFYIASKNQNREWALDGNWALSPKIDDAQLSNGAFNLERTRFYFSACKTNSSGKIDCDLYVLDLSQKNPKPIQLPSIINTKYTETQVAVGKDYKEREVVYFVSDRKEGKGGLDIWYTTYDAKRNTYKAPRNCGSKVNSVGDELTPFINPRNRKLFFSSNGHAGYGQLDIFEAAGERSKWSEPVNMGNAVNTGSDDLYYIESEKGGSGFFVSNRKGAYTANNASCCDDLFYFVDTESIIRVLQGKTYSENSKEELSNVSLKVYQIDEKTKERYLVQTQKSDKDGSYSFSLDPDLEFVVVTEKDGYYKTEKLISTKDYRTKMNYSLDVVLQKITDQAIIIDNIYYDFNRAELTESAMTTIDTTILPIMLNNPQIVVEIGSHTDGRGTDAYNKKLSQDRAESVVKYLRKQGIAKNRIQAKGYGKSKPIAPNQNADGTDNPEGRAKNRRTEFKVIGTIEVFDEED